MTSFSLPSILQGGGYDDLTGALISDQREDMMCIAGRRRYGRTSRDVLIPGNVPPPQGHFFIFLDFPKTGPDFGWD